MKKVINLSTLLILVSLFVVCCSKKNDSAELTDKICKVFDTMKTEINSCNSIEDFDNLNFEKTLADAKAAGVDDTSMDVQVTPEDKTKIKAAINGCIDTMAEKTTILAGGMVNQSVIDAQFILMREMADSAVDNATTFKEMFQNFDKLD